MDYNQTLNLPKTDFPMRASLSVREPGMLPHLKETYAGLMERNKDKPAFILHDGPPFSNNDIHAGTALNKILKDFIIRYKNMAGRYAPYVPGWDNHGMPIESTIIKKQKLDRDKMGIPAFRDACAAFAAKYVDVQREQFIRLGVLGDWDNPYLTMDPAFEAREVRIFGEMFDKGLIYKGLKPVYWCTKDRTALAEAEVEYHDNTCDSIYVKFPVKDDKGLIFPYGKAAYFLIWTTTPWTLPGNTAICVNPSLYYSLVEVGAERYVLASDLIEQVAKAAGWVNYGVLHTFRGHELEHMTARHPFLDRDSLLINGTHVTSVSGTGCVHTAPGHGAEDYAAALQYKLPMLVPVDDAGIMTEEAGAVCAGLRYDKANTAITEHLMDTGLLLATQKISHTYPHCWRCASPILFRATPQWFASVEAIKDAACAEVERVTWLPGWGKERMLAMVRERNDWCISRQRHWGLPIPVFYCEACEKPICTPESIDAVAKLFAEHGSNVWYQKDAAEFLPQGFACPHCGGGDFTKETDTLDCWFDSGSTHDAVLRPRNELRWPADLYIEGSDQYRGWFQSSLLTAVATGEGSAPYGTVISCGWVVDGEGRKMSKSLGNGVDPTDVCNQNGADILRLWVASSDYHSDMRISPNILKQLGDMYLKIRNTCRFLLGNLFDYAPGQSKLSMLDQWALARLEELRVKVIGAYERYEFHPILHAVHNFCVLDMSNFYLDIVKDTLYCEKPDSPERRAIQSVLYTVLDTLTRLIAPILAFTSEEIWSFIPGRQGESPLYAGIPAATRRSECPGKNDSESELCARSIEVVNLIFDEVRPAVNKALENARNNKTIGKPLEAAVTVTLDEALYDKLLPHVGLLQKCCIVSALTLVKGNALSVEVFRAEGGKCERCWGYFSVNSEQLTVNNGIGANPNHPTLCARCAKAVTE
ncbi:MAG: isoleucine--tRNA ligase [Oscillospiraceae bacterium]|jgi:isoleucyl-tRNA synthetase|nr:isoleucine--tRNA ligase [Oscillospiraceae bacterium]